MTHNREGREDRSSSDGVRLEATRLLNAGEKIQAIKFVREKKGLGLAQAKAYVDALASGGNPDDAARSVPATSGGCSMILAVLGLAAAALIWLLAR